METETQQVRLTGVLRSLSPIPAAESLSLLIPIVLGRPRQLHFLIPRSASPLVFLNAFDFKMKGR